MKKIQKRLLGVGGVALVAAITTVACNMPDVGATTASGYVDVSVNVVSDYPEIKIISPLDGAKLNNPNLRIQANYSDADAVIYTLTKGSKTVVLPEQPLAGNATATKGHSGAHDFVYNLKEFEPNTAGYGDYVLNVKVERNGHSPAEDSVGFSYIPASIAPGTIPTDENNNPIIDLNVKTSVVKIEAIVLKADGSEAFRAEANTNGETTVYMTLPFSDNNMESGNYTVKFVTYSYNWYGALVPDQDETTTPLKTLVTYTKKEEPEPEVPDDDTPPTPQDPSAGDKNNPEVPAPKDTKEDETVHVVVTDPETGKTVIETDLPVNKDGTVTVPFDGYNLPAGDYDVTTTPYVTDPGTGEKVLDPSRSVTTKVHYDGKTPEKQPTTNQNNGNPIIPITNDGTVEKAKIIIGDKDGKEIASIIVDIKPDQTSVEVPLDKLGLSSGDYTFKVITYSKDPNTGKLAPNQNPHYVQPIPFHYNGGGESYQFVDPENKLGTHVWNRNKDAGTPEVVRIPEADAFRFFDANEVYFTTAANVANLYNSANRLNPIYFTAYEGSIVIELSSAFLATLPNGDYYLGTKLTNGADRKVKIKIEGEAGSSCTKNPNPVIDINVEEGIEKVEIIVLDQNKKELFRFEAPVSSITTNHITLPFDLYCLGDADYLIAIIPYGRDGDGNLVPIISEADAIANAMKITYGAPEVPNTGNFFMGLNLSSKDFLLTGLIIFAVVTAGGIFVLRRKETRR